MPALTSQLLGVRRVSGGRAGQHHAVGQEELGSGRGLGHADIGRQGVSAAGTQPVTRRGAHGPLPRPPAGTTPQGLLHRRPALHCQVTSQPEQELKPTFPFRVPEWIGYCSGSPVSRE